MKTGAVMQGHTGKTLLIVDDDPLALELARAKLVSADYAVVAARDGVEALQALDGRAIDLVVTDLDMPNLDGLGLLHRLRMEPVTAKVPVVVVTGVPDDAVCSKALDAGADAFIRKPLDWALVRHQIAGVLKAAEREMALMKAEEAAQAGVMMRDALLAILSHELRTPLNSTIGFSRLLLDEIHGPLGAREYRDYARFILDASERLSEQAADALLVSRISSGTAPVRHRDTEMRDVIGAAMSRIRPLAETCRVSVRVCGSAEDGSLQCDPDLMSAAFAHLLRNAIQHSPENGEVTLSWGANAERWWMSVSDNGPGVAEALRSAVLKPFVQANMALNRDVNGIGLGLAIVKAVANLHGAHLNLETGDNGGTCAGLSGKSAVLTAIADCTAATGTGRAA